MPKNQRARTGFSPKLISLAVASCFAASTALANPTGATVAAGQVSIQQNGNLLQVTNSPSSIINWQSFSINANEVTRFLQQSSSSAVLNRVIGAGGSIDPSVILGALQSNGRVFLINPSGIVFGAGAQIDVAGLVASSLHLSDTDFLAGRLRFTEVPGAGSVLNQGNINAGPGGQVYLVGPSVTNSGIITSPQGEVVLAAGNSVELVNPGTPNLRVEINAPSNEARNLGTIVADAGRVGIYAGLVTQGGAIRADSAQVTDDGRIVLKATRNVTLEAGSVTSASGPKGGSVEIQSGDTTLVAGTVEATGSAGQGGTIKVLGSQVGLIGNASLDASGDTGGGVVLVGGDFQGRNPDVPNAFRTYFGPNASIKADAVSSGDGGRVVVWSDDATRAYGSISAKGGSQSGDGGFVEVSGKKWLDFHARVDTSAANGRAGTLLLDPSDVQVGNFFSGASCSGCSFSSASDPAIFAGGSGISQVSWSDIGFALNFNNVVVNTQGTGGNGDITVVDSSPNIAMFDHYLSLLANRNVVVNGVRIWGDGELRLFAGWDGTSPSGAPVLTQPGSVLLTNAHVDMGGNVLVKAGDSIVLNNSWIQVSNFNFGVQRDITLEAGNRVQLTNSRLQVEATSGPSTATIGVFAGAGGIQVDGAEGFSNPFSMFASGGNCAVPPCANASASIALDTIHGAGPIQLTNTQIQAQGLGASFGEGNGDAQVRIGLATPSSISISGSAIRAIAGEGCCAGSGIGGTARILMTTVGLLQVTNSTLSSVGGRGGSDFGFTTDGGPALTSLTGGSVGIANSTVTADGGPGANAGSGGTVRLEGANGVGMLGSHVAGTGGAGGLTGGFGTAALLSQGPVVVDGGSSAGTVAGTGGNANSGGTPGIGSVFLQAGPGGIRVINDSVEASGGLAGSVRGPGLILLALLTHTSGGFFVNGVEGAVTGAPPNDDHGFFVNGQPAVVVSTNISAIVGGNFSVEQALSGAFGTPGGANMIVIYGGGGEFTNDSQNQVNQALNDIVNINNTDPADEPAAPGDDKKKQGKSFCQ